MARVEIEISGMKCGHCVKAVREALNALDGIDVEEVVVGRAVITASTPEALATVTGVIEEEEFHVVALKEVS